MANTTTFVVQSFILKRGRLTRDQIEGAHRKTGRLIKDIAAELGKKR